MKKEKTRVLAGVLSAMVLAVSVLTACGSDSGSVNDSSEETELLSEVGSGDASADKEAVHDNEASTETIFTEKKNDDEIKNVNANTPKSMTTEIASDFYLTMDNHFGFNPAFLDYGAAAEAGARWGRPHFELFTWGLIEPEKGEYYFIETDHLVQEAQRNGFHLLANLQPRSLLDEAGCYDIEKQPEPGMPVPFTEARKPCDMEDYKRFVSVLVERYDGDGVDDMPGLTMPIKHWEIMNEPEFPLYFLGTPGEYLEIVKASSDAIKAADPDAVVVQGGMAGMDREMTDFWQQVFDLGVAEYFDVFNMHSIGHGEHLNIPAFRQFLTRNGVIDKPVWVTEVQYQQARQSEDSTAEEFAAILSRSYLFALANGVDKFFYVNLLTPFDPMKEEKEPMPGDANGGPPFDERSALIDDNGLKTPLFYAHRTITEKLGQLSTDDEIVLLNESVGEWFVEQGQYKFVIDGHIVYALWGTGPVPVEIQGTVIITEMSGESRTADAGEIILGDNPVFVEPFQ